ncbi:MAG TPA: hypothetical protein ENJ99_02400 [Rhizobiales bacterium]|nr:hypothetical protein [Hyphomicrobiales bacterium]
MHRLLARAAQHHKGRRFTAVAFAFLAAVFANEAAPAKAVESPALLPGAVTTGTIPAPAKPYEIRITQTRKGSEGLELNARLDAAGGYILRPISWTVRESAPGISGPGETVFSSSAPLADMVVAPGRYEIEAHYGHALSRHTIEVLPGTRIAMTLILNVGGVRALTRVAGVDASRIAGASHTIISLDEANGEKIIATSVAQGEIVRLPAGRYRIESRFAGGNTVASADVTVKPGILTSMQIDHQAALARLTIPAGRDTPVNWQIKSLDDNWSKDGKTSKVSLVLAPGRYMFSATVRGHVLNRKVRLEPGKATVVLLSE